MKNLLCLTLLNYRPRVSEVFLEGMKRLGLEVLGASLYQDDKKLMNRYGHECLTMRLPETLGSRWNYLLNASLYYSWTHLLISGDDNLFSNDLLSLVETGDYQGLEKLYFIEPSRRRAQHLKQDHGIAIGTGRIFSRRLIEESTQVFPLKNRELDHEQDLMLYEKGLMPVIIDKGKDTLCIDIKHEKNMWAYDNFTPISTPVDYDDALVWVGEKERELIEKLES